MVVPPWYELPPTGYGGIEQICSALIDTLYERGHQVTLFGAGTHTGTKAHLVSTIGEPQYPRLGQALPEARHTAHVNRLLAKEFPGHFDVIHDHTVCGPLTAAARNAPTVVTVHHRVDSDLGDIYTALNGHIVPVAISRSQRSQRPDLHWAATIHNAIQLDRFTPTSNPTGPVLWLARFSPDKGPDLAIQACRAAGLPLILAGKCNEPDEVTYFNQHIKPLIDGAPDVGVVLNGDRVTTNQLLAQASCLILPIRWHEPFGMVMIEAMASGTPVVALNRGSVPEVISHGVTGWICNDPAELPAALRQAAMLNPADCVTHARINFNADLMAARYEHVYQHAINTRRPTRTIQPPARTALPAYLSNGHKPATAAKAISRKTR